jgi:glycosyltransferase involved in cell wall biosynthesis
MPADLGPASGAPRFGDAQYTRDLLADPPNGFTYVPYQDALASGELLEDVSWRLSGPRPGGPADAVKPSARLGLHAVRRARLLLPDLVRWWFDVVHIHSMPTHLSGAPPPAIVTDSTGTLWYWTRVKGYREDRAWGLLRRERKVAALFDYVHPSARPDKAAQALYFVQAGADLVARAGARRENLDVCPVGVPNASAEPPVDVDVEGRLPTLIFAARNFEIKGAPAALEVHRRVGRVLPEARLLVAGPSDPDPGLPGVVWLGPRTRAELYAYVYPQADVFISPTRFDGAPLVVMESLAHAVPVVAPVILGIPELVRDGESGFLFPEGGIHEAVSATLRLLCDAPLRERMGRAGLEDYGRRFSFEVRNRILGEAYLRAATA